jgi:hypothetical protein
MVSFSPKSDFCALFPTRFNVYQQDFFYALWFLVKTSVENKYINKPDIKQTNRTYDMLQSYRLCSTTTLHQMKGARPKSVTCQFFTRTTHVVLFNHFRFLKITIDCLRVCVMSGAYVSVLALCMLHNTNSSRFN